MVDQLTLIANLEKWYQTPLGSELLATEKTALDQLLPTLFGYHLLQLGGPCASDLLENSKIPHRVRLSPKTNSRYKGPCIQCAYEALPVLASSIDVMLILQILALANNPQQVLLQSYDALVPEGVLVIFGFNRLSLFGGADLMCNSKKVPWHNMFLPAYKVRKWLTQVGFSVVDYQTLFFRPPLDQERLLGKINFLETIGKVCWSSFGGVYLIVAKKQKIPCTPLWDKMLARRAQIRKVAVQSSSNRSVHDDSTS